MSSATSSATSAARIPASSTARAIASPRHQEPVRTLRMGTEEAAVLKLDLSDIPLPKIVELNVDGFKPSFLQRLFGKR